MHWTILVAAAYPMISLHLEIIIFKGFSSSTTHPIEIDLEKKAIEFRYILTNFKLFMAPLNETKDNFIRENQNSVFFLNKENWN